MSRFAAFGLFALAAFDVGVPWLDRAGLAALALGFTALAIGRTALGLRPAPMPKVPPARMQLPERRDGLAPDRLDALAEY